MPESAAIIAIVPSEHVPPELAPAVPSVPGLPLHNADADVMRLIQKGDLAGALRALMRQHGNAVYKYCRSALADSVLAEDVHQQVFIQAYRDLHRFLPHSSIRSWLFAIARHRVLDAVKCRRRDQDRTSSDELTHVPATQPLPSSTLDDLQLWRALEASLAQLSESVRSAVVLRYQGLTFEEIATIMGGRADTMRARVARALPFLRAAIEERLAAGSAAPPQTTGAVTATSGT